MHLLTLFKAGETLSHLVHSHGDFEDWILDGLGIKKAQAEIIAIHQNLPLPEPSQVRGLMITGSHTPVADHRPWAEETAAWLKAAVQEGVPILGICFGHQLLAYALGGSVEETPAGPEFGTIKISLMGAGAADPLFGDVPGHFFVQSAHYQSVVRLPDAAVPLAASARDPHAAFRIGNLAYGVQFHPEFKPEISAAYIQENVQRIQIAGDDPADLLQNCRQTPAGQRILTNFLELVQQNARGSAGQG